MKQTSKFLLGLMTGLYFFSTSCSPQQNITRQSPKIASKMHKTDLPYDNFTNMMSYVAEKGLPSDTYKFPLDGDSLEFKVKTMKKPLIFNKDTVNIVQSIVDYDVDGITESHLNPAYETISLANAIKNNTYSVFGSMIAYGLNDSLDSSTVKIIEEFGGLSTLKDLNNAELAKNVFNKLKKYALSKRK